MTLRSLGVALITVAAGTTVFGQVRTPPPLLIDGHVHITNRVYWEGIDPWKPQPIGLWDYARARQGGVNVVIENVAPYGYNTYNATVKQTGRLIENFHRVMEANRDKMELALTAADVRRIVASGKLAVILGIESGFDQEGDLDILRLWYRLGLRLIQFSSQLTNSYADSSIRGEPKWSGINDRGRRLIAEMNRLGILIDIAHATETANGRSSKPAGHRWLPVMSGFSRSAIIQQTCLTIFCVRWPRKAVWWVFTPTRGSSVNGFTTGSERIRSAVPTRCGQNSSSYDPRIAITGSTSPPSMPKWAACGDVSMDSSGRKHRKARR